MLICHPLKFHTIRATQAYVLNGLKLSKINVAEFNYAQVSTTFKFSIGIKLYSGRFLHCICRKLVTSQKLLHSLKTVKNFNLNSKLQNSIIIFPLPYQRINQIKSYEGAKICKSYFRPILVN